MGKYDFDLINGPINIARVEGEINGIKKVLYLFMDYHLDVQDQSKCDSFDSIDFQNFLAIEFKKMTNDKILDFFFEANRDLDSWLPPLHYRKKYILEVFKYFHHNIKLEGKKVIGTKISKNIRFHYADIRNYTDLFIEIPLHQMMSQMNNVLHSDNPHINDAINVFKSLIPKIRDDNDKFIELYNANSKGKKASVQKDLTSPESLAYILYKIKHSYSNKNIINKLASLFDYIKVLNDKITEIISKVEQIIKIMEENYVPFGILRQQSTNDFGYYPDKAEYLIYLAEMNNYLIQLSNFDTDRMAILMDIYFIRRFTDKDYILNGVAYTGINHSCRYIYTLINQFDFKLTHVYYSKYPIEKCMEILKKIPKITNAIYELFFPLELKQCTDISKFPTNFS